MVGGISAELDGGKFGHGFASSVLTSGADYLCMTHGLGDMNVGIRIVANAIIAGTISEVTGGKFANGAMSAAFRVAFNELPTALAKKNIRKMKNAYDSSSSDECIVKMCEAYREFYSNNKIGVGSQFQVPPLYTTHEILLKQMVELGYASDAKIFTFNKSMGTELQNIKSLSTSVGKYIQKSGQGNYSIGIAAGTHTITLQYDGGSFKILDQGTGWDTESWAPKLFDEQLTHISHGLVNDDTKTHKSYISVYKLKDLE